MPQTNLLFCPYCETPVETSGGAHGAGGSWYKCTNPFCEARGADGTWTAKVCGRGSSADRLTGRERRVLSASLYRELLNLGSGPDQAYNVAYFADAIANTAEDYLGLLRQVHELAIAASNNPPHLNDSFTRIMDDFERVQFDEFLEPDPTSEETHTEGSN
jgi:hypothetical protein